MSNSDAVHRAVADRYTAAGTRAAQAVRGASTPPSGARDTRHLDLQHETGPAVLLDELEPGALARFAGYGAEEEAALPAGALKGSFACGHPLHWADLRPGETVLDVGCGQGVDLILAAREVGPHGRALGVDLTPAQLAQAERNLAAAGLANVELRQGTMEALPFESGTVDWVISNGAINYSPDKARAFAEILRVLKPGGELSITDVLVENLAPGLAYRLLGYVSDAGGAAGREAYLNYIRDAGFDYVTVVDQALLAVSELLGFANYTVENEAESGATFAGHIATIAIRAKKPG